MDKGFEKISENALIEAAFRRAEGRIEESRINPEDFRGCEGFSDKEIEADIAEAERLDQKFEKSDAEHPEERQARNLGKVLEAILDEQVELGDWLGGNVLTVPASKIDDYTRKVDGVAEILEDDETSHFAIAMDATIGGDSVAKLRRIKEEIDGGELGGIKYFYSERTDFRGKLENVPRVVIAVDGATIKELTTMWMDGDQKGLNHHKIQFQILREIILQAETFRDYASRVGKEKVAGEYGNLAEKMQKIYEAKAQAAGIKTDDFDSAYNALKFNLKIFED